MRRHILLRLYAIPKQSLRFGIEAWVVRRIQNAHMMFLTSLLEVTQEKTTKWRNK